MNQFVNLTPHAIVLRIGEKDLSFQPSGTTARVTVEPKPRQSLVYDGTEIPVVANEFGAVDGLPEVVDGTIYIVSAMVLGQCQGRSDVVAPDTGATAVRNEKGHIEAVTRFVCA